MRSYTIFVSCLLAGSSCTGLQDLITVHNTTSEHLFVAVYYTRGTDIRRCTDPIDIAPSSSQTFERPARMYYSMGWYDRDLYFALQREQLHDRLVPGVLPFCNVGTLRGTTFYIAETPTGLVGYQAVTWAALQAQQAVGAGAHFLWQEAEQYHAQHPYVAHEAEVRQGPELAEKEQQFIAERLAIAQRLCEQQFGEPVALRAVPRIALCSSGGGYRAMISTLGFLQGACDAGWYDLLSYHSALSGSSWALGGLMQSGLSPGVYLQRLLPYLATGLTQDTDGSQITQALLRQYMCNGEVTPTDFFGALLAQKLLRVIARNPHHMTFAEQADIVQPTQRAFPLYSALMDSLQGDTYHWLEFTPYEVGCPDMEAWIPTWAFGRKFFEGRSTDAVPPQSLGYCMGIWGAAMSANMREMVKEYQGRITAPALVAQLLQKLANLPYPRTRLYPAQLPNWIYGLNHPAGIAPTLAMFDAGVDCALPFPPLLRPARKIDIIVVLDASRDRSMLRALRKSEAYAKSRGLPFPPLDYAEASQQIVSVHESADPLVPTIVYIPLAEQPDYYHGWDPSTESFTATLNFTYTPEQVRKLSGLTYRAAHHAKDALFGAVKRCIAKKEYKGRAHAKS